MPALPGRECRDQAGKPRLTAAAPASHRWGHEPARVAREADARAGRDAARACRARLQPGLAGERRWRLTDPELSPRHLAHDRIGFDPFDLPRDQFLVGGQAWQLCRSGRADPHTFGLAPELPQPRGLAFVRGHVVQDLAALNKMELLLWDVWGVMLAGPDAEAALLDEVAERTQAADGFADVRRLYATPGLTVPGRIRCLSPATGPREVALDLDAV